mmetsp:Transcript_59654/g.134138  ORF Transcript_59654/g.134138 Transcript_59654/m.134138 type:complete len:290 (-) Transcript_59654:109-978(-)
MCLHNSRECSGGKLRLAMESRCLQKSSVEMRSSPFWTRDVNRSSAVTPLLWTCSRKAMAASEYLASTMAWQDLSVLSMTLAHFLSTAPALPSILAISFFASSMGPLVTFGSFPSPSLMAARADDTPLLISTCSFSACSKTERGVAKASRSAPCNAINGCVTSSMAFRLASIASTFSAASAKTASAAFFSRASMCAFFSAASFFANSALAIMTFFLSESNVVVAAVTFPLNFAISVRASTRGPLAPAVTFANSASLVFMRFETWLMLFWDSVIVLSIALANVENGVMASK